MSKMKSPHEERQRILTALRSDGPFLLTSHEHPDGDSIGSMLALHRWFVSRGVPSTPISLDGVPEPYTFVPSADAVVRKCPADATDFVAVVVDTPDGSRMACGPSLMDGARELINIDHHHDNPRFGTLNLVDASASSAALIVFELLEEIGAEIDTGAASLLYVGVLADTGGFRFGNTDPRTLAAASRLAALGAEPANLAREIYGEQPIEHVRLLGRVLESAETVLGGTVAVLYLTEAMRREVGAGDDDIEGLASYGRLIRGVEIALLLREENGRVRVNLRSKGAVDVSAIAKALGGGGHEAASGVILDGPLTDVREKLLAAVARHLE